MGAQGGLILIILAIVLFMVYFLSQGKKNKEGKSNIKPSNAINTKDLKKNLENLKKAATPGSKTNDAAPRSRYTKSSKADVSKRDLFEFMDFDKIQDDMIIQDKGTKFTMVIQCKGINYDLMSEVEQLAVEEGFITFLNTLKSPIQLYVQARAIDLKTSLDMYKERVTEFNKEYEDMNDQYNRLANDMSTPDNELKAAQLEREKMYNISEYAHDITRYVERLSLNKHMLQRKFYVVLSYYKSEITTTTKFNDDELFDICYRELYTRAEGVISALQNCSVQARVLDSDELAELIYITYNRDDQRLLDIRTALDSGYYRLYTQSKDVLQKRNDLIKKQIQEEAVSRVENALRIAIEKGQIITEDQRIDDFENDVDKTAVLLADELDIPEDVKHDVQEMIIRGHQQAAEERKAERAKRDAEIEKEIEEENNHEVIADEEKVEEVNEEPIVSENEEEVITDDIAEEPVEKEVVTEEKTEPVVEESAPAEEEKKSSIEDEENDSIV